MQFFTSTLASMLLLSSSVHAASWSIEFYANNRCTDVVPTSQGDVTAEGYECTNKLTQVATPSAHVDGDIGRVGGFQIAVYSDWNCGGDMAIFGPNDCPHWGPLIGGGYVSDWKSFAVVAI